MFIVASVSPVQPCLEDKRTAPAILEAAVPFTEGRDYSTSGGRKCVMKLQDGTLSYIKKQPDIEADEKQICHASEQRWVKNKPDSTELDAGSLAGNKAG